MAGRGGGAAIAVLVVSLAVAACGGSSNEPAGLVGQTTEPAPTDLRTEPQETPAPSVKATARPAKATPKPTKKPAAATPEPTKKPRSYYKPPGWDGVSDVDCKDFDTHAHAQSFFEGTGGSETNDPHRLDRDHNGIACESLP